MSTTPPRPPTNTAGTDQSSASATSSSASATSSSASATSSTGGSGSSGGGGGGGGGVIGGEGISPTSSSSPSRSYKASSKNDPISKDFIQLIEKARTEDFSDLIRCGCVQIHPASAKDDVAVVVVLPKLAFAHDSSDKAVSRMMELLLLLMNDIAHGPYILIYAQTPMKILSQQSVVYKYYNMLPFRYRKNIKKLYILRPGFAVKVFFEFSRVFLSVKFYQKLQQFSSLTEMQTIIPPNLISFPLELHHIEDQELGVALTEPAASIDESFIAELGTTHFLHSCINYLRENNALSSKGIFRISGDDMSLTVVKIRLQKKYCKSSDVYEVLESLGMKPTTEIAKKKGFKRFVYVSNHVIINKKPSEPASGIRYDSMMKPSSTKPPDSISTVYVSEINSIAQLIKFIFRDFDEPIITLDAYHKIENIVKTSKIQKIEPSVWVTIVVDILKQMPFSHWTTLDHLLRFLAEVASKSAENSMTPSNLAIVFGPGVMRKPQSREKKDVQAEDVALVMQEMALGQTVVGSLIEHYLLIAKESSISVTSGSSSSESATPSSSSLSVPTKEGGGGGSSSPNRPTSDDNDSIEMRMGEAMLKRYGAASSGNGRSNSNAQGDGDVEASGIPNISSSFPQIDSTNNDVNGSESLQFPTSNSGQDPITLKMSDAMLKRTSMRMARRTSNPQTLELVVEDEMPSSSSPSATAATTSLPNSSSAGEIVNKSDADNPNDSISQDIETFPSSSNSEQDAITLKMSDAMLKRTSMRMARRTSNPQTLELVVEDEIPSSSLLSNEPDNSLSNETNDGAI